MGYWQKNASSSYGNLISLGAGWRAGQMSRKPAPAIINIFKNSWNATLSLLPPHGNQYPPPSLPNIHTTYVHTASSSSCHGKASLINRLGGKGR